MRSRTSLLTSVAVLGALTLAACGGSGSAKSTTLTDGSSQTTAASGTAAGTTAATDVATTSPNFSGNGSGNLCDYAKAIDSSKALDNAFSGKSDSKTLKDGFTTTLDVMNAAVSKAPSEIKADLQTVVKGFKTIVDFYASYDYDVTKLTAAMKTDPTLASKMQALDSAEFTAASDRVDAYFTKVCGISSN